MCTDWVKDPSMPDETPLHGLPLHLTWDSEAGAGYLPLARIGPGKAVSQRVVANPVDGIGDIIVDFDADGRLLGVEFLDERAVPPGMAPS
jgi:uncharacterized protein YuzE